ncbi:hypothetical protein V7124_03360 [Neobacillus niacini]|jgi:hypothetical protein|uniref:hypothetical protein n=1 Tax=Neobacillus niacini TaxID=86668 RepID=UPI0030008547
MQVGHPFKIAKNGSDEYFTPAYAVQPVKKYLKPNSTVWCPFDTNESHFVKELRKEGHTVIATHIENGEDFFNLKIDCDYIISNPPYSVKIEVIERLFELGIPFAMLIGVVGLFDSKDKANLFKDKAFEVMYLSPRVGYFKDYANPVPINGIPYQSVYLCSKLLPKQIVFEEVNKNS